MKCSMRTFEQFMQERIKYYSDQAQKYALKMTQAEQSMDQKEYIHSEAAWQKYERYWEAACADLNAWRAMVKEADANDKRL